MTKLLLSFILFAGLSVANIIVDILPQGSPIGIGQTTQVTFSLSATDPILGWGFALEWDPSILEIVSQSAGPLWFDVSNGTLGMLGGLAFPEGLAGDNILLAELTVKGVGVGTSRLSITVDPSDFSQGFALDPTGFAAFTVNPGALTVTGTTAATVPEPSAAGLLAFSLAAFAVRRRQVRRHSVDTERVERGHTVRQNMKHALGPPQWGCF